MTQVTLPQNLAVKSLEALYQLMGNIFVGEISTRDFPVIEQQVATHDMARDVYIAEAKTPQNGIGAGIEAKRNHYYIRDGFWDVQAGYYYKDVVADGQNLQLRVERYAHFFGDNYILSLRTPQGKVIAEVDKSLTPIIGSSALVQSALVAMGNLNESTLPVICKDPLFDWVCGQ